ncbi:zinc ribbon domain-containing protein [Haloechinothrix halophila]|uniref:zinc ribbon domain-containing protein n=1 Tax=Haloechinothrix halophila TaxID=1069073 RepID=UPI000410DA90|nr:C4-type zinc ribbon domain-containing protein [Haloechinothrix halophila]
MKVDPEVQRQLLELADVDAELGRIEHRRKKLPELEEIAAIEKDLRAGRDALVAVQTSASDLDREVTRQEREIESVRAREDKDRSLMASGSVSAKQLTDLEHELETLKRRQSALEDDLLELMERREAVAIDEQRTAAEVDEAERKLAEAQRRRDEAMADLDSQQAGKEEERTRLVAPLPADLLAQYERVRAARGRGAGLLRSRRCGTCQLELDHTALSDIKNAAPDAVVTCENCGAILVRTEESGL